MNFKRFDIDVLKSKNPVVVVFGKKWTGKTTLVEEILVKRNDKSTVFNEKFDEKTIDKVITDHVKELKTNAALQQLNSVDAEALGETLKTNAALSHWIVLDDVIFDNHAMTTKPLRKLFINGMCYRIGLVITMQYPINIPPDLRTNVDYVFVYRVSGCARDIIKKVYNMFGGFFDTFEKFESIYNEITSEPHRCMVIDTTKHSLKLEDVVYWYKVI
jgi:hypothetical protein